MSSASIDPFNKRLILRIAYWLTILLGIVIIALASTSCVTAEKCLAKFPPDTIRTVTTVYRDTTVNVIINKLAPKFASGNINAPLIVRYGNVTVKTWVKDSTIFTYVTSVDTTLKVRLDSAIRELQIKDQIIQEIRVKYTPKWVSELAGIGGLVVGAFIFWFVLKGLKFFKII